MRLALVQLVVGVVLFFTSTGCASTGDNSAQTTYNPASGRMGALAGIPPDDNAPVAGVVPNLVPFVDASKLAAANLEASTVRTGAGAYLSDHPSATGVSSDALQPPYLFGQLKAKYRIGGLASSITRVDSVDGGWVGMVFTLSQQRWIRGAADGDHENDQDVP